VKDWRAWALVVTGVIAGFLYSNFLLDMVLPGTHDWSVVVSELEKPGYEHAVVLRTTDVICGLLVLALLPYVRSALPPGRRRTWAIWLTAAFAVGNAVAGAVPLPTDDGLGAHVQQWIHDGASTISQTAVFLGAVAIALDTPYHGRKWLRDAAWLTFWLGGVLGTILFGGFALIDSSSWQTGMAQRFQIAVTSLWVVCLGVFAATDGLRAHDRDRAEASVQQRA
jgi:hypothetical protein